MKSRLICVAAIAFGMMTISLQLAARVEHAKHHHFPPHHHYILVDLGTLGGPDSIIFGLTGPLNDRGMVSSCATTSVLDPNFPNINPYFSAPGDSYIQHTFLWRDGVLSDLGTLRNGTSSCEQWISDTGLIVGGSTNGLIDSLSKVPEVHATLWLGQYPLDLETLGGNESIAFAVNNIGQIAGGAANKIPDENASFFFGASATQIHAVIWSNGVMRDLHTLGEGLDSMAYNINELGQVAGMSFTDNTINSTTGVPTVDVFLWENGKMFDLGTFGGTQSTLSELNNKGQVSGWSNLAGDMTSHPFIGDRTGMKDLGTLGGTFGQAWWLNDSREVVGWATTQGDQALDAFSWRNGLMTDLKTLAGDSGSIAEGINASGQVVGQSFPSEGNGHAFLWENSGPMVNLQSLVLPGSDLTLTEATFINDRGEVVGNAVVPNGDQHAFLLIPCDENHPGIESCDYRLVDVTTAAQVRAPAGGAVSGGENENSAGTLGWRERLNGRVIHGRGFSGGRSPNN
jgi:probable HAF family extracellular repeat protein